MEWFIKYTEHILYKKQAYKKYEAQTKQTLRNKGRLIFKSKLEETVFQKKTASHLKVASFVLLLLLLDISRILRNI